MNRLRELRAEKNLSLKEVEKELDIDDYILDQFEKGEWFPNEKTQEVLANFYGVSVPYILGFDSEDLGEGNEVTITKHEYKRLKDIEEKYKQIKRMVDDGGEDMLCKKQVGEYAKKVLDEAKRELPKSATSNITEAKDKNEDYMTCVINFDRGKWITENILNHHYERLGAYDKSITFNYEQNRIEVEYNVKTSSDTFYHCLDKYKIGETIIVIDGFIQKEMNVIEIFTDA